MISALSWVPRGSMKRVPHAHDPHPEEVEAARARALAEAGEEEADFASDPAFASLRGVKLPPGFMDDSRYHIEEGGGRARTVAEDGVPGAFGRRGAAAAAAAEEEEDEDEGLEEEDLADMEARPSDAFLVVASTADDFSSLEVYVYNEEDGSLYVRHDITLPSFPVCLAWMDYAGDAAGPLLTGSGVASQEGSSYVGSFCAVGSFDPSIELWNLDIVDPLEPTLVLKGDKRSSSSSSGSKAAKPGKKGFAPKGAAAASSSSEGSAAPASTSGHSEAVLGLSWNRTHRHLLASASADGTVKVWDIDSGGRVLHTVGTHAGAKVHSCAWNPSEPTVLASASYDRTLAVMDARAAGAPKVARYALTADPECLLWDPHRPACLLASQSDGSVLCYDARSPAAPLWSLAAHSGGACTSLAASVTAEGLLATGGMDKSVRLWDTGGSGAPVLLSAKAVQIGKVFTLQFFPGGDGGMLAAGGSKGIVALWNTGEDAGEVTAELIEGGGGGGGGEGAWWEAGALRHHHQQQQQQQQAAAAPALARLATAS